MSPSYWPVSSVMQLCLYRLLAVTSAVFSHADQQVTQPESTGWVTCWSFSCQLVLFYSTLFLWGVSRSVIVNPSHHVDFVASD